MAKLTKSAVDALALPDGRSEAYLWDAGAGGVSGFGVRATAGAKSFVFVYRIGKGRKAPKRKIVIGRFGSLTVEQARTIAKEMAGDLAAGRDPRKRKLADETAALTVGDLLDAWGAEGALTDQRTGRVRDPANVEKDKARLDAHVRPLLGKIRLAELTRSRVERARDHIIAGKTANTSARKVRPRGRATVTGGAGAASRTLKTFIAVCGWGVRQGMLTSNPAEELKLPPSGRRERVMSTEEVQKLAAYLASAAAAEINPSAKGQLQWLLATGCRLSEAQRLRWQDVDLERGVWALPTSKTGASVRPIARQAIAILSGLTRRPGAYVFPSYQGGPFLGLPGLWRRVIREKAGLPDDLTLHALRHSFATAGAIEGHSPAVLKAALGHAADSTTLRYTHSPMAAAQAAAEAAAARLMGEQLPEKPAAVVPIKGRKTRARAS
jgi:integrase